MNNGETLYNNTLHAINTKQHRTFNVLNNVDFKDITITKFDFFSQLQQQKQQQQSEPMDKFMIYLEK
jgi:hypothetical protein